MQIFAGTIQPMIQWLEVHPEWMLLITFFVSFAESLAVIGSIVPGSVTMTAIGILSGSGVVRIDLTLIAATLGAVAGDSASYLLGYYYSDRLKSWWPFSKYPHWLEYGQSFFEKHGGKSVLIGRFVGPIRSIIPVIAGMLRMNHLQFYTANILSAIGWSILYVFPGFLIGAASNELSPENATRLFILILACLFGIWLATSFIRWMFIHLHRFTQNQLHNLWAYFHENRFLNRFTRHITPAHETHHTVTASLLFFYLLSSVVFLVLFILHLQQLWLARANEPFHHLLQSVRTSAFDVFFIAFEQVVSPLTLGAVFVYTLLLLLFKRDYRALKFFTSLTVSCLGVLLLLHQFIPSARPGGIMDIKDSFAFPAFNLTYASALYPALLFYLSAGCKTKYTAFANGIALLCLTLSGAAMIYLGDHWLSDVLSAYALGINLALLHGLLYRHHPPHCAYSQRPYWLLGGVFFLAIALSFSVSFQKEMKSHQPYFAQYVFTDERWWNQEKPLLPVFRHNRFGQPVSYFNLQYVGSLVRIESALNAFGWKTQSQSFYQNVLRRLNGYPSAMNMPLIAQLYLNRKPALVMTYESPYTHRLIELRMWRSNYHLKNYRQPIWIGSVHVHHDSKHRVKLSAPQRPALYFVRSALTDFMTREMVLPQHPKLSRLDNAKPRLLLIKETPRQPYLNWG